MKVLFVHQNFPAQFTHMAAALARDPGNRVVALAMRHNPAPPGVEMRIHAPLRAPGNDPHPFLEEQEAQVRRAEGCAAAAFRLRQEGFVPDVVVAHPGWGEALFLRDVFPAAKLVLYCEYYYAADGQDVGFDPEFGAPTFAQRCRIRLKNSASLLSLEAADAAIAPTEWQRSTYPAWARSKIAVIHDGIDLDALGHDPRARLALARTDGAGAPLVLRAGDEVLTYVARHLEPLRGFHVFMRALPEVLRRRPRAHVVVVGAEAGGYGAPAPTGRSWRAQLLDEVGAGFDLERVHFLGQVPRATYLDVLKVSAAHAYWTVPFVLSWSMLEAALAGTPVLASATPPVAEFAPALGIRTLPFRDVGGLADGLVEHLARPRRLPRPAAAAAFDAAALSDRRIALLRALL